MCFEEYIIYSKSSQSLDDVCLLQMEMGKWWIIAVSNAWKQNLMLFLIF